MNLSAPPPPSPPLPPGGPRPADRPRLTAQSRRRLRQREAGERGLQRRRAAALDAAAQLDRQTLEREQLAQWLHDELGGLLVQLRLAYGSWRSTAPAAAEAGAGFDALLAQLSGAVRRLNFALAPPAWHEDLRTALAALAAELGMRSRLQVQLDVAGLPAEDAARLPARQLTLACRVVRELVLNVTKHAQARRVHIAAALAAGQLCIQVRDDGRGLPADAPAGLGLRSARAQLQALGGRLMLQSAPGQGTCATLLLPTPTLAGGGA